MVPSAGFSVLTTGCFRYLSGPFKIVDFIVLSWLHVQPAYLRPRTLLIPLQHKALSKVLLLIINYYYMFSTASLQACYIIALHYPGTG